MSQTDEILARLEEAGQSQGAFGGIGPSECRTVAGCITQLRSRLDEVEKELKRANTDPIRLREMSVSQYRIDMAEENKKLRLSNERMEMLLKNAGISL